MISMQQYVSGRTCLPWLIFLLASYEWNYLQAAPQFPVSTKDFVAAIPIDDKHVPLAKASRAWRKGMRTLIVSNSTPTDALQAEGRANNEIWSMYPDDWPLRALYGGDTRAALAPFIAHKAFGDTYKWMLYGDDDTVFFVEGAIAVAQDLDPNMPYFITDHMWWSPTPHAPIHPRNDAPRCLPCNFNATALGMDTSKGAYGINRGCPCKPQDICSLPEFSHVFNGGCNIPRHPQWTYSMHGGAGALISIGLMRAISLEMMEKCIQTEHSTGGDAFVTICMWKYGYGTTDPGYSFYHPEVQMFDPGPEDRIGIMVRLSRALDRRCDDNCKLLLSKMVTLHVRSRHFPTMEHASHFIKALSALYEAYTAMKDTGVRYGTEKFDILV